MEYVKPKKYTYIFTLDQSFSPIFHKTNSVLSSTSKNFLTNS